MLDLISIIIYFNKSKPSPLVVFFWQ